MKNKYLFIVGLLLISNTIFGQKINKDFIDGEIYIKVKQKPPTNSTKLVNFSTELPFLQKYAKELVLNETKKSFFTKESENLQKIYRLKVTDPEKIDEIIKQLKNESSIDYVEKVRLRSIISTPNDPNVGSQWSLSKIRAFEAWNINSGLNDVIVAVVDNAIQTNHADLQANMLAGKDVSDGDNDPNPPNETFSHGTHVAGILSAVSNNAIGIASASNNRIKILPVKATPDAGTSNNIYHGYEGITWAADNGAKIISLSWGGAGYSQAEQDVINYAASKGILIVAAAGNENTSVEHYPSAYTNVIAVASTETDDKKSSFSNFGTWVDISAPGRGILSTIPYDSYASFSGTSMSTPLVSSALGYIWSCYPLLTPTQVENLLKTTADNIDEQNSTQAGLLGMGRINLFRAIACPNGGVSSATITANSSTYICKGESVQLNANTGIGYSYVWLKDGINQANTSSSLTAIAEGNYKVIISKGECNIISNAINVTYNQLITSIPTVTNKEMPYCSKVISGNGLKATAINCNFGGPTIYSYAGPTVGYDGFEKSGENPTVNVGNLGGKVANVKVSITWQKKDSGNENTCDISDGGGIPYNEEISFKLKSPNGTIITLLANSTYAKGTTTSGIVTTIFQDAAATILENSLPISGTFAPNQPLATFINEVPIGTWTLLPEDDGFVDPLCVQGFSLTLSTDSPNQASKITWWDSNLSGNLLASGIEYTAISTSNVGTQTFYAQAQCDGLCPSDRVATKFITKPVPLVYAYPISLSLINDIHFKNLVNNQNIAFMTTANNETVIFDANNKTESVIIGNTPPLTSPISLCANQTYLLLSIGCSSNIITWNNAQNGQSILVTPTTPISYYAYCHHDWTGCTPINSNTISFESPQSNITINDEISPDSQQTFVGKNITASNTIQTPAKISYKGFQTVMLKPGFSVSGNSIFSASIVNGCNN
ncbi:S8 family serine peptidase [Emticicia sp. SJ17W-69]|uniref:S8 family serine peptidase n=1 Tax=Emticicia sp. SJ17W-69 TaxID=3421657 RepID=UPI003EBBAADC